MRRVAATALLGCAVGVGQAQAIHIPEVHANVLTGQAVDLPAGLKGRSAVLVLGFSQASRDQVTDWAKRLAGDYRGSNTVVYYEMPVLESVPKLLRGFVTRKMGEAVPDRAKDRFLPVPDHEKEWKAAAAYSKSDDAYVLVVDADGVVRSHVEGAVSDAKYDEVRRQLREMR